MSAALFGAKVLSDLRYLAAAETTASAILNRVNKAMTSGESMFVTLSLAVID